jgi:Glycosyl transferase family 2
MTLARRTDLPARRDPGGHRILGRVARDQAPAEILDLAEARARARRAHDWPEADRLREQIAAAGWTVADAATLYSLERAAPADIVDGEIVRYGSSASVPSRLLDAPLDAASVVLVATDWPDDLARALAALDDRSPVTTQVVVVANGPSAEQAAALDGIRSAGPAARRLATEVVWTAARLGHAAALNVGVRRAAGRTVVFLDTSLEPRGDLVSALVDALDDPTVAVAGPVGIVSPDMRRFEDAPADMADVDAIDGCAMAFRRSDYAERGPLDEHFALGRSLDTWWSLLLRDQGEDEPEGAPLRRAARVAAVPVIFHEHRERSTPEPAERERRSKKDFYRFLKRFATRRDLLVRPG